MLPLHFKFQQTAETFLVKKISEVFMYACALLITQIFLASIAIIIMSKEQLENNETFVAIFGFMLEEIRDDFRVSRAANLVYLQRRCVLLLTVFFLNEYVVFQLQCAIAMNLISMMYVAAKPHSDPVQNQQEMFCEYLVAM